MLNEAQTYNDGFVGVGAGYVSIEAASTLEHTRTLLTLKQLLAALVHWMHTLDMAPQVTCIREFTVMMRKISDNS